jgi:outer membrane protein TolC
MSTIRLRVPVCAIALLGLLSTFVVAQAPAGNKPADDPKTKESKEAKEPVQAPPPPATILQPCEQPIDLGSALLLAGVQNPELLLARERITEAAAARMLAAAQALPNLNLGTNYDLHRGVLQQSNGNILNVRRDALYLGLGAYTVGAGTVNIPGIQYNLHISTAWFDYLQRLQLVARTTAGARTTTNDVLLRVCLAYSDLVRAYAARAIALQNRTESAEVARITEVYARAGQGREADANRANVDLRKRDAELTQAEGDILVASARLAQVLNLDPSVRLKPIDGQAVPVPVVPDPLPLTELIAIALLERPELEERRAEIVESLYALSSARLVPFVPSLILGFSSGDFGGGSNLVSPRFGKFGGRVDFDTVLYWTAQNLGVGNCAQIHISESRSRQADLRRIETLNLVRSQVAEAYARVGANFLQIDTTARAIKSSQDAYEADLKRIKQREGLPIELLDSLRLLGRSRYEHLDAITGYNKAQFQLYVAIGQPPAEVLARPVPPKVMVHPSVVIPGCPLPGAPGHPLPVLPATRPAAQPASVPSPDELGPAPRPVARGGTRIDSSIPAQLPEPVEGGKR